MKNLLLIIVFIFIGTISSQVLAQSTFSEEAVKINVVIDGEEKSEIIIDFAAEPMQVDLSEIIKELGGSANNDSGLNNRIKKLEEENKELDKRIKELEKLIEDMQEDKN